MEMEADEVLSITELFQRLVREFPQVSNHQVHEIVKKVSEIPFAIHSFHFSNSIYCVLCPYHRPIATVLTSCLFVHVTFCFRMDPIHPCADFLLAKSVGVVQ